VAPDLDHTLLAALPDPHLVLTPDFVMRSANQAYLDAVGRRLDELVGHLIEDVFPVNPADPTAAERVTASFRRVVTTRATDHAGVVRYDVPLPGAPGTFESRYWSVTCSPVLDDAGEVVLLVQRVRDVTAVRAPLLRALEVFRVEVPGDADVELVTEVATHALEVDELARALATELAQVREAMASRATIEQAKGIVMAGRRCTAEEGFATLVELSQHSNRKLRDVAADLVSDAPRAVTPAGPSTTA
jgi:response regulator NasT